MQISYQFAYESETSHMVIAMSVSKSSSQKRAR